MDGPIIDPRMPDDLAALLDANEVNPEEGAIVWELEKRDLWIYLSGPDKGRTVQNRWEARVCNDDHSIAVIGRGKTARLALARAYAAVIATEQRAA